jgi:hypothetical protein
VNARARKCLIYGGYSDIKKAVQESHPKLTKRRLEEFRAKLKAVTDTELWKMVIEHLSTCCFRFFLSFKKCIEEAKPTHLFNFSCKKDKIVKIMKSIAGLKEK